MSCPTVTTTSRRAVWETWNQRDLSRGGRPGLVIVGCKRQRARERLQARDLERLNQAAQRLNAEAADVIEYQGMDAAEE